MQSIFYLTLLVLVLLAHSLAETNPVADRILVVKSSRTITLFSHGKTLRTYKVALGSQPVGAKQQIGDHKTPEGQYAVSMKLANSQFHRALRISYPNQEDIQRARKLRVDPGGLVEIHGLGRRFGWLGALHRKTDWTDGCIAVSNEEIDEIWKLVPVGTPVEIRP
jgi:murein L,D-transpeptidase YafK